ncbi:MAG: alpha/beta hydrolase [Chloroflexota bacterium]
MSGCLSRRHFLTTGFGGMVAMSPIGGFITEGSQERVSTSHLYTQNVPWSNQFFVESRDGTELAVYTGGNPQGQPLIFIHGILQSALSWSPLLADRQLQRAFHLIAIDLRGHGQSGKPDNNGYALSQTWADDIHSILTYLNLRRPPILVGWSYGGAIIADYIRAYGEAALSGLVLVGTSSRFDDALNDSAIIPLLPGLLSTDYHENINALLAFVRLLTKTPQSYEATITTLGYNADVPRYVRQSMFLHRQDYRHDFAQVHIPTWIAHGSHDEIVPLANAYTLADIIRDAGLTTYEMISHMPFIETPQFRADLLTWALETSRSI